MNIYENETQPPILTIRRGFTFIQAKIQVSAGLEPLGHFRSKLLTLGGGFNVFDNRDQVGATRNVNDDQG